jgi:hypothetical protein
VITNTLRGARFDTYITRSIGCQKSARFDPGVVSAGSVFAGVIENFFDFLFGYVVPVYMRQISLGIDVIAYE